MTRVALRVALAAALLLQACSSSELRLLHRAEERLRAGSYDEAVRLHNILYERNPQGRYAAQALLQVANIQYMNLRQIQTAVESYEKLLDEFPGRPEGQTARLHLARIFENELGDITQAIVQYDKLIEMEDLANRQEIEYQRASAYIRAEDYHSALRELSRLEEEVRSGHLAHKIFLKMGSIYQVEKKYEQAIAYFGRVSDAPCQECRRQAILSLANCYEASFDFDKAAGILRQLDATPENQKLIAAETARLENKRRRVNSSPSLDWGRGHR